MQQCTQKPFIILPGASLEWHNFT